MIHTYEDYVRHYDAGEITPSWDSGDPIGRAKRDGWPIGWWRPGKKFLALCRQSPERFQKAYEDYGVDFWIPG
jgi:hypothetical protein